MYKDDVDSIIENALGLETYHNFTLLHDDLMDKADVRRGNPTVHKKWDANTAILSGDAMLILAPPNPRSSSHGNRRCTVSRVCGYR